MKNLIIFGIFFMFCIKINLCEDATARALEITQQWRPMSLQMNTGPASQLISVSNLEATNKQHLAQIAQHNAQILRHIKGFHQPVTQYHNPFAMYGGQSASQQQQQQQQRNKENIIQQQHQQQQHHNNGFISGKPSFLGKQELNPLKYNNQQQQQQHQQQHSSTMKIPGLIKHNSHYYTNDFNNLSQQQQQHQQLLTTKSPLGRDVTLAPSPGLITKSSGSLPHPVMNKLHTHLALASRHQQQQQQPQPIASQSNRFESFAIPSHVLSSYSQFGPASHIIRDTKPKVSSSFINYPIELQSSKHGNSYPQNYVSASQFVNANHPALAGHNYNTQTQSQQNQQQQQQQQHQSSFSSLSSSNQNQLQNHNQILNYQHQNIFDDHLLSTTIAPTNFPILPPSVLTPFFQNVQQQQQKFETNNYDQLADNENNNHFNTISDEFTKHLVPPPPYKHTDSTKFREKPPLTTITTINDENKNVLINKINLQLGKSPLQDANRYVYNTGPMFLPTIIPDNDSDNILSVPPPPSKTNKVNKQQQQQQQIQQQQHSLYNSETFFTTEKPNVFKNLNWASNSDFKQHKLMHPSYTGVNRPIVTEQSTYAPMLPTPNDIDHEDVNSGITHSFFTIEDAITAAPNFGDFYKDVRINHKPIDSDILKIKYKDAMRHEDGFHYESAPSLAPAFNNVAPSDYPPPSPAVPSASPSPSESPAQTPSPSSPPVFKYEPITTSATYLESSPESPSPSLRPRGKPKNRRRRPKPQHVDGSAVGEINSNDNQQSQRHRPNRYESEQKSELHDQNQEHDREPVRNSNDFRNNLRNRQRPQPQTSSYPTVVITEKPHRNTNRKPDIYKYSTSDESIASSSTSASASDEEDFEKNIKVNINENLFLNNYKTLNNENRKRPVTTSNSITTTQDVHQFLPTIQSTSNDKVVTELEHELPETTITNNHQPFITRHRFAYTTTVQPSNEQFDDITSVLPEAPITEQQPATVIITNENEFFTLKPTQTVENDVDTTQTDDSAKSTLAYEHVRHRQKLRYKEKNEGQHTVIITTTTESPIEKQTDQVEVTSDSNKTIRLRPLNKYNANNRPRFSVKEYRQRLSTSSTTTESNINHESTTSGYTRLRFPTRNRVNINDIRNKANDEKKFDKTVPTAEESIEEVIKPEIVEVSSESAPAHTYPKRIPQKQLHRGQLSRITNEVSTTTTVKPTTRRGGNWREFSSKNRTSTSTVTPIQSRTTEINENINSRLVTTRNSTFVNRRPQNISLRQRIQNYYRKKNDTETADQDSQQQQSNEQSYESDQIDTTKHIPSDDFVTEEYRRETAIMKIAKDDHSYRPYAHTTTEPSLIDNNDLSGSPSEQSQRVAELTLSGNMGSTPFKSVYMRGGPSRRIPGYFTLATEDPILPIEAFFPQVKKEKR